MTYTIKLDLWIDDEEEMSDHQIEKMLDSLLSRTCIEVSKFELLARNEQNR